MKKLVLFTALLLITTSGFSQIITLLDEDFTGNTIPAGWSDMTGAFGAGSHHWSFGSNLMPGSGSSDIPDFPNNAAIFDDDAAGDTGNRNQRALVSPYIDAYGSGSEYVNANLRLRYHYSLNNKGFGQDNYFDDKLEVYIWDDNGNFIRVAEHTLTTAPVYHSIIISDDVYNGGFDSAHFRIVWQFDDIDGSWGQGAGVDDVYLMLLPDNDACQNAIVIPSLPYTHVQNAIGSTNNDGFINPSGCGNGMNDGVWYTFTPTASGQINISASLNILPNWDLEIGVYTGACGNFTCVAYADDEYAGDGEHIDNLSVTAGTQYFINIGHYHALTNFPEHKFMLMINGNLSISENNITGFEMYPNPTKDILNLSAENNIDVVSIYNILGQEVLAINPKTTQVEINTTNLQTEAYIVKIQAGNQVGSYKLIKE